MKTDREQNLDQGWQFSEGPYNMMGDIIDEVMHVNKAARIVNLPHDSMIESDTRADVPAGPASGYYTAGVSHYTKKCVFLPNGRRRKYILSLTV